MGTSLLVAQPISTCRLYTSAQMFLRIPSCGLIWVLDVHVPGPANKHFTIVSIYAVFLPSGTTAHRMVPRPVRAKAPPIISFRPSLQRRSAIIRINKQLPFSTAGLTRYFNHVHDNFTSRKIIRIFHDDGPRNPDSPELSRIDGVSAEHVGRDLDEHGEDEVEVDVAGELRRHHADAVVDHGHDEPDDKLS